MESEIIEPEPELRLILIPSPDDAPLSSNEYQKVLRDFSEALKSQGLGVSSRWHTNDAVGAGGGFVGEFVLAAAVLGTSIQQIRKLIETVLDACHGRKVKLQLGNLKLEGGARDVEKILEQLTSSERFQQLVESQKLKKRTRPLSS